MKCPSCGASGTVSIRRALVAKPIGSFSLAGAQMKVSAVETVAAECSACDLVVSGQLEKPTYAPDGSTFTGGRFIADARACTGLTARWCAVHGDCACSDDGIPELRITPTLDDPDRPLHAPGSSHPRA